MKPVKKVTISVGVGYGLGLIGLFFVVKTSLYNSKKRTKPTGLVLLAEKERFELSNRVTGYTISNRARSTNYATSPLFETLVSVSFLTTRKV